MRSPPEVQATATRLSRVRDDRRLAQAPWARKMGPMTETSARADEAGLEADLRAVAERHDREAFGRIFAFYAPRVKAYLRRLGAFVLASTLSGAYGLVSPPPPGEEDRLAGTIGEPNQLAAVLVAGVVIALALGVTERRHPLLRIFYFEEKPHSAIAEELGLPLGTVKSRLRLALSKLRVTLSGLDG